MANSRGQWHGLNSAVKLKGRKHPLTPVDEMLEYTLIELMENVRVMASLMLQSGKSFQKGLYTPPVISKDMQN